jgi:phosphoserine phosphatase
MVRSKTAFLFDLDGTLIDSVYQHVLAWKSSLDREGIQIPVWTIHRKIGMSGGLFANILLRETGFDNTPERLDRLRAAHAEAYKALSGSVRPLPGARDLLDYLTEQGTPWAIATSGRMETAGHNLAALGVDPNKVPSALRRLRRGRTRARGRVPRLCRSGRSDVSYRRGCGSRLSDEEDELSTRITRIKERYTRIR